MWKASENITYTEITIDSDRVIGVKVCNHSEILEVLLYVYMPFYNDNVAQIELYLEAIDVLQSVGNKCYTKTGSYTKDGFNQHSNILYQLINDNELCIADFTSRQDTK